MDKISFDDFLKVDIRVGKIVSVSDFPEAKKPAYKLRIDFGKELGVKNSSVQIIENYSKKDLENKLVLCVVNFPKKQIGPFMSDVLTLGVPDNNRKVILITPDKNTAVINGRLF